ncbi:hypothetical protein [Pigmentibacter ruber]|uniref:hypothetical protein n=1 Tax=Pigmentibacter ruber TaxID=2683196 RepID=UPI00131D0D1D|nr:hypothetical protein [Pigmentibacter ruber]
MIKKLYPCLKKFLLPYIFFFLLNVEKSFAQEFLNNSLIPNLVFYDANSISINKNNEAFELNGNAIILIGNIYISANNIILQKKVGLVSAEGNVNLISNKQKAIASRIIIDLYTKQLRMDDAKIISDPKETDEKFSEVTLGISKAELAYEAAKDNRTKEIENELKELREEYARIQNLKKFKKYNDDNYSERIKEITSKYARLLARLTRTQFQPNAFLEKLSQKDKEKLLDRRSAVEKFKTENPEIVQKIANFSSINGYVKIAASQIIQKDNNTLILNNSIITPCNCSPLNEPPIYGFSSENAKIEMDNYITMRDVTVDFFTVPVFYSPWLKFPIKNKRESGFLTPSSYTSTNAGSATVIPYFIVLGPYADSTITYEYFSGRGSQFSGEFRFQIDRDSQFKTEGKFIKDKTYLNDYNSNSQKIDTAIAQSTSQNDINTYNSYRGSNNQNRWYTDSSVNLPLTSSGSLKSNYEDVSDNLYLSDYSNNNSNINPTAAVFGDTSPASRRFLNQDVSTEYYGDNFILSLKIQSNKDLFSANSGSTPYKSPKFEFDLLPAKYFNTPFIFSNNSTFENIVRQNNQNYIPVPQTLFTTTPSNSLTGTYDSNYQRNPNDPYAQGKRAYTSSTLTLPVATNDYFNSNISATAVGTQYYFPDSYPYQNVQPYLGYLSYKLHLDVPLYSSTYFMTQNNEVKTGITQNLTPFIDFNYTPSVTRSSNFPNTYQLWYDQDKTVSSAIINFGATLSWTIEKEQFIETKDNVARLPSVAEPGVANLDFFRQIIEQQKFKISNKSEEIYNLSSQVNSNKIFDSWAKTELENYYDKISATELNQNYIWPAGNFYTKKSLLTFTPLSLSVSTGYNLIAEQTARETNSLAGPNVSPVDTQKYTDIIASANLNMNPVLPLSGNVGVSYNQYYQRISSFTSGISAELPYGLGFNYTNNQQFVINPNSNIQNDFIRKTQQTLGVDYTPLNWLKFSYQWSKSTDPTANTDTSDGKGYGSSQSITFMNLQNCLDLMFARNKPAGITENMSTYVLSLTFRFFGYSYTAKQLGDYLDRKLKD